MNPGHTSIEAQEAEYEAARKERGDSGGPAFPSSNDVRVGELRSAGHSGMTLRDYFAAHAPAMPQRMREMASSSNKRENGRDVFDFGAYAEFEAAWRMRYADAMLKARSA